MTIRTHTKDDGTRGVCRARPGHCPKGQTEDQHMVFETEAELKAHNEKLLSEEHGVVPVASVKRDAPSGDTSSPRPLPLSAEEGPTAAPSEAEDSSPAEEDPYPPGAYEAHRPEVVPLEEPSLPAAFDKPTWRQRLAQRFASPQRLLEQVRDEEVSLTPAAAKRLAKAYLDERLPQEDASTRLLFRSGVWENIPPAQQEEVLNTLTFKQRGRVLLGLMRDYHDEEKPISGPGLHRLGRAYMTNRNTYWTPELLAAEPQDLRVFSDSEREKLIYAWVDEKSRYQKSGQRLHNAMRKSASFAPEEKAIFNYAMADGKIQLDDEGAWEGTEPDCPPEYAFLK